MGDGSQYGRRERAYGVPVCWHFSRSRSDIQYSFEYGGCLFVFVYVAREVWVCARVFRVAGPQGAGAESIKYISLSSTTGTHWLAVYSLYLAPRRLHFLWL